ncbi:winged helix-turn-helix domain-containing protein [Chloroflexota bacterium]
MWECRRSSIEVIADILRLGEASNTEIQYAVNLSYFQSKKYVTLLQERNLIDKMNGDKGSIKYKVTSEGSKLLSNIDIALDMLKGK